MLQIEFPAITYVDLEGYDIHYGRNKTLTTFKILRQLPKILIKIKRENRWLSNFISKNRPDAVISDNRYGFYNPKTFNILVTHQLNVTTGFVPVFDRICRNVLNVFISRFDECWVPDLQGPGNIAGTLSHPSKLKRTKVNYIGPLSRFDKCPSGTHCQFDVLILLSGPEPQRSIIEKILLDQVRGVEKRIALVRGLPSTHQLIVNNSATVFNYLNSNELNHIICQSALVISRPGYTTMMDLIKLKKKTIVIPTPGQPEQEYLARHLSTAKLVMSMKQSNFSLVTALERANTYPFRHLEDYMEHYKPVIADFVETLSRSPRDEKKSG